MGIQVDNSKAYFFLPKGFEDSKSNLSSFQEKRDLFFLFFRIFNKFEDTLKYKKSKLGSSSSDRDGIREYNQGASLEVSLADEAIFIYNKLSSINLILEQYDELKILDLKRKLTKKDFNQYHLIHKHIHNAIFLPDNSAFIDLANLPDKNIEFESTDIIGIYCYIAYEIKRQIHQYVPDEIISVVNQFKSKYIGFDLVLFDESDFDIVNDLLKTCLEKIHSNTTFKDPDYWNFYDAVESFLYGNLIDDHNGKVWGIDNFHSVWEAMCITYALNKTSPHNILYLDSSFISVDLLSKLNSVEKRIQIDDLSINGRRLFPDLIVLKTPEEKVKERRYVLRKDKWDDFHFKTTFNCDQLISEEKYLKIAYLGQSTYVHTIEKISEDSNLNSSIEINKPLSNEFYSFWIFEKDNLSIDYISDLHYLRHIFYVCYLEGMHSFREFFSGFLEPLGIRDYEFNRSVYHRPENVLYQSLWRDIPTFDDLAKQYTEFVFYMQNYGFELSINIIDAKYNFANYFLSPDNIELVKSKDVRKQFVYEYLIKSALDKDESSNFKNSNINSQFWLPTLGEEKVIEFMDDFLSIKKMNFLEMAKTYLS
ncbi:MAG: hypothetical protein AAF620_12340 [Bacteroidota bacterium]